MQLLDVQQGTLEWLRARVGVPTASEFKRIITKTGKPSAQAEGYLHQIVAEWLINQPIDGETSGWMERGSDLEAEAVAFYEFQFDRTTSKAGFCLTDDGAFGCSPDRLVGEDGGLEIKCPSAKIHVGYMLGVPHEEYIPQVQGCMLVTGRRWWDFISYNPLLPVVYHRYERDDAYIETLSGLLADFDEQIAEAKRKLAPHRLG